MKKALLSFALIMFVLFAKSQIKNTKVSPQDTSVYAMVENPAEFPGGVPEFTKFLVSNINYSPIARQTNKEGIVITTFIVEKDGSLTNIKIVRGVTPEIDAEAIRVLKLSPKWNPANMGSIIVRQQYSVPIGFTLRNR